MGKFVVLVDFRLKPDSIDEFRTLVVDNARKSLRGEPGCKQFDVLAPAKDGNRLLLYEVYESKQAFDEHLKTPHLAEFVRRSDPLVEAKSLFEAGLIFDSLADPSRADSWNEENRKTSGNVVPRKSKR